MRVFADGGAKTPVYWGFVTTLGVPTVTADLLEKSQVAVILDLDETLLVANSASTFENRMDSCRRARCVRAPCYLWGTA